MKKRYSLRVSNKGYLKLTTDNTVTIVWRWKNNLGNWWDIVLDIVR